MGHGATQRGRAKRLQHRPPPCVQPAAPLREVTADVHGYPRGVAPLRHPLASRDTPGAHTGEETTPSPHHATGGAAHPSLFFSPPGHGFSTLEARCNQLI